MTGDMVNVGIIPVELRDSSIYDGSTFVELCSRRIEI